MIYLFVYITCVASALGIYYLGWQDFLKRMVSILLPSLLIIIFTIKTGGIIFKSPIIFVISIVPTVIFVYRGSLPLVGRINDFIDNIGNDCFTPDDVVEAEVISKKDV